MSKNYEKLYTDLPARKADLILLILTSQNIETIVEKVNNSFNILVDKTALASARNAVDTYYRENRFFRIKQQLQQFPISSFKSYTAFSIMGILCFIHAFSLHYHVHDIMILKYGASALFIVQGENFRTITALFLHADVRHLLGNMAGLLIFGAPVITLSGFGAGSFMLLFAGTLGNLMNAHLYKTAHLAIGASTAIMGAAGLLAAYQITLGKKPVHWNSLMPLFAGAILVGMLSQGERTDIWAHVLGFLSGLASGIMFFPLNRMLAFPQKEAIFLIMTTAIIAASWLAPY